MNVSIPVKTKTNSRRLHTQLNKQFPAYLKFYKLFSRSSDVYSVLKHFPTPIPSKKSLPKKLFFSLKKFMPSKVLIFLE